MALDLHHLAMQWQGQKADEVFAVMRFLTNANIKFLPDPTNIITNNAEPVDVFVRDVNKKFQVTLADPKLWEMIGKTKPDVLGIKTVEILRIGDEFEEIVQKSLEKKRKYGNAAKGIILLIDARHNPPPSVDRKISNDRKSSLNQELIGWGFDEIYLVCRDRNIQIYP